MINRSSERSWAQITASGSSTALHLDKDNARRIISRPKRNVFIGTGETAENESFTGRNDPNKKVWLFISRIPDKIDETAIRNYVKRKSKITDDLDLIVKHIPTKIEQSKADSKCFQVGIKFNLMDTIYQENFWPRNVAFGRFNFRRHPSQSTQSSQETESAFLEK